MAIEGRLGPGGVADLLASLWHSERTGTLELTTGAITRTLAVSSGAVVYVISSEASERLAVRLVGSGAATKAQLVAASKAGGDLRSELPKVGGSAEAYDQTLRDLVVHVVESTFECTEGKYALVDREDLGLPGVLEDLSMTEILWDCARKCSEAFAAGFVGSLASRVILAGEPSMLEDLPGLSPQEGFLVSRIDGYGSVQDLLNALPLPREEVLRLVVGLCVTGYIEIQGRPGVKLPRPARSSGKRRAKTKPATPGAAPGMARLVSHAGALPGMAPAVEASPELELEGMDAVRSLSARAADLDHYALLGVGATAGEDEVRRAYYKLARAYHPDRFGKDIAEADRDVVEALFARISEAFAVLGDPEARSLYDQRLKSGALAAEKAADKAVVDPKELARASYEKGRALAASGDRSRAMSFFEHAAETDRDNWEYRMALARLMMGESRLRRRAEQQLIEAIRIDQSRADAYHVLGQIYKLAGVNSRAIEQFREGLKWEPQHAGILADMADLGEDPGDSGGGLLGGLFKKK